MTLKPALTSRDIDRIIEMAWEDRTPFEAIEIQFGLKENEVIKLMRQEMKLTSFKMWRKRMYSRKQKHGAFRSPDTKRFRSPMQKSFTF